jgi:predicted site-specific integrase-resolvase
MNACYVSTAHAKKRLGIFDTTLRTWANHGWIEVVRTPGGQRLYNVDKFISENLQNGAKQTVTQRKICYCRVSSAGQKDDLERQKAFMQSKFPTHEIICDVGSGLNFKRKGLQTLLDHCFKGMVSEVVVAHRDRLCRFGFDLLEWTFHKHGAQLVVLDQGNMSPEDELANDLISIVHVFSCRINGKRKYAKKGKENEVSDNSSLPVSEGPEDHPDMV